MSLKTKALFLDRDGVINHDEGYTSKIEDFRFIDGIFELCREAKRQGYLIIVVTNQAGIGRGYYTEQDFLILTDWMKKRFEEEGAPITDVYFCPYHAEHGVGEYKKESLDRKPNPGMLLKAAEKYQIDLSRSIMIGDKESDMEAAGNAGVSGKVIFSLDASENLGSNHYMTTLSFDFCLKSLQTKN
ncbi:D-glycero-alpha-D-manno-heptose-1,7-bisphosphate 7-phosphatase [Sapientia aquatica]|uniref:D,D-heptose 1,7-bisphosphate phosphatase n=1 Tax=Sapientia aquatica TaxID=1549640 RepID=A0A4R5W4L5_9BURK|nr:HAD family hydrolase [Sapientia aquatica]TDK66529.1 HAD family hydrolase [Sapientia aquatica]